ncbi:LTA synthase family protein [Photobacterium sp. WH77]|uniref:LTA synthase family protein n=1 Tax=unclassified Photobacterium TaxID=2628852 RepID=UPI001EDB8B63|nr:MULTISPECIES: LTA synthase family protein [unclassified Photobacterium]MCG2838028.1 LTA synthase family protein [Photobacterium sp. WH77]MCG2845646.1 LTA synthase family protein [Photobacterium sp. WH80]
MQKLKPITGVMFPIALFALLSLILLSVSRVVLTLWQIDHITGWQDWASILLQGVRVDVSTLCWLLILPSLLLALLPTQGLLGQIWLFILRLWLVAGLWILVYMELATPSFISEYNLRPNRLFIEYLVYPKEVFSMLWVGYKLELAVGLIGSVLTLCLGWLLSGYAVRDLDAPRWYWRPVLAISVVALGVMGARSTFQHRPLNPAMVAFSTDPLLNDLTLNSSYSVIFAAKNMASEKNAEAFYGTMPLDDIIETVRASSGRPESFMPGDILTLNTNAPTVEGKKNLVILLQESLGARFVGGLGGLPLTPNLDALMQEGWNFTQVYATGTRSVRGIEAMTTGFTPTPSRAVVKLSKSQTGFYTIAGLLDRQGYHTQFIYGGESHFDNMKSFFLGNGFEDIVDLPDFVNPKFVGSWGASDQDLYQMADKQFTKLHQTGQPFFSLVFTSSNHSPYEFPDGEIELYEQPEHTRNNAVKYSDKALGEFFAKARQSEYWKDTVFIVIADHDARAEGNVPVPVDRFHIPAVILGEDIQPRQDDRLASNIDMAPTLLSLIGADNTSPMIGHDLTKEVAPEYQRAMMQFDKNFGYLTRDKLVVLQPGKAAIGYQYDFTRQTLTPSGISEQESQRALAHALLGGKLYREGRYRLPPQTDQQHAMAVSH